MPNTSIKNYVVTVLPTKHWLCFSSCSQAENKWWLIISGIKSMLLITKRFKKNYVWIHPWMSSFFLFLSRVSIKIVQKKPIISQETDLWDNCLCLGLACTVVRKQQAFERKVQASVWRHTLPTPSSTFIFLFLCTTKWWGLRVQRWLPPPVSTRTPIFLPTSFISVCYFLFSPVKMKMNLSQVPFFSRSEKVCISLRKQWSSVKNGTI